MKTASFRINRETTSYVYAPQFISLPQDVDHNVDMTLNERPNIDHGDDTELTEASETSPFNDYLSLSLSPLVSSNEIGFLAAPRSVRMFRCESEHSTSSVGSNQFSCDSGGARSEGTNPTQMDYYQQPQMSDSRILLRLLKQKQDLLDQQRLDQQRQALLDQQRLFLDPSQSFPRWLAPSQTLDMPQAISTSLPQAHLNLIPQQISGTNSQQNLISFSHPSQQPKQSDFPGHVSHTPTSNQLATAGTGTWAPPPSQFQRMRTFTKVYKRGAVGRSIDITRYSGYEELKQDLARIFSVEGQLDDRYRVGWKLVYVDHESDVLLVGGDPWEEFVHCVRCIKILSPQEVQAMSLDLDGDFGNSVLPNQLATAGTGTWAPPPSQFQRMRTYTMVFKRGSVGRSIDVTRYSGYEELRQELARIFGIEGQLEDRHRVGWKLVFVDHEGDVLLVGDYPWEEFVHCVRCIKILSPQEVQAMSLDLDGDFGNSVLPNQACSTNLQLPAAC